MLEEKQELVKKIASGLRFMPLAEAREQYEIDRKVLAEPIALTETEAAFDKEYHSKRKGKTPDEERELDRGLTQREWLILEIVLVKHILNGAKLRYKQALEEQKQGWLKYGEKIKEEKEWFKSLAEEHKVQAMAERNANAYDFLEMHNITLTAWEDGLVVMSRLLETDFIYEHPLV
jgi:hypothetical protein